ncbi:MBL fold metallo-hydrolase [Halobacillus sp. Marseille-Q1614]|uniref:MBL fold metallo-hydrolase n=1 Tax=Halobacillus sp. Marseille-Q1614 TaxID=2709134 RepID=UPI00156E0FA6|nr:MBL fold metallo-hydrolase [Halobacillus sp. Marseille-Q1614]
MKTIKDRIHPITLPTPYAVGDVHAYLFKSDKVTLIDAGVKTTEAWEAMKDQLAKLGIKPEDIDQIVLTHHHPDHTGLVEYFPDAIIMGHPKLRPWLEKDEEFIRRHETFFKEMYEEAGVPSEYLNTLNSAKKTLRYIGQGRLQVELTEGDRVPSHEEWTIIETPGHAQCHISLYREADGALIGGDHLLFHISSNPLLEPPFSANEARPRPQVQYRDSLEKLLNYQLGDVYPGHGRRFTEAHQLIKRRITRQEERADQVKEMLKQKPLTAFEVCQKLFPKQIESQFGLTISETMGQLDYLEFTGQVDTKHIGKRKIYYVNR